MPPNTTLHQFLSPSLYPVCIRTFARDDLPLTIIHKLNASHNYNCLNYHQLQTIQNQKDGLRLNQPIQHLELLSSVWYNGTRVTPSSQHCNSYQFLTSWSANSSTVLSEKRREQKLKRSSSDGPNSSITITL